MKTHKFLGLVLAHEGLYCVWANRTVPHKTRPEISQEFYPTISEAVQAAEKLDKDGWNAFFALATFGAEQNRKADNVLWMKSFFLDLDCGPSKDFVDQEDAIERLQSFCVGNKLPMPTLVNSGRGVHVYWVLDEPVCREDWFPVAERFKKLCVDQGFPADPSRTSDAASILRVPNTHNYKYGEPLPVQVLGVDYPHTISFDAFSELMGNAPIPVPQRHGESAPVSAFKAAMYENHQNSFSKLIAKIKAGRGCTQIAYIINNQDTVPHDLWRAGLSIANVCVDGEKAAQFMSKKHPDYDPEDTLAKMRDTGGPQYCATFASIYPEGCEGCVHKGKITTPVSLTKEIKEDTEDLGNSLNEEGIDDLLDKKQSRKNIPSYPHPYFRGRHGGIYMRTTNAEGDPDEVCVYHNDFYVTRRLHDVELGEVVSFALQLPKDGLREFVVPLTALTSAEEFRKYMAAQGITAYGRDEVGKLMKYVQTWVNELQETTTAAEAHQQFGWVDEDTMEEFVLGDQLITAGKVSYNPPSSKTSGLISSFRPKGSKERSREILNFYSQEGMELQQFVVCGGFGTILMPLTGLYSLGIHLFGSTGGGKTTAMYANTSIWGEPRPLTLTKGDTNNSRFNRAEVMHNLGLNTDEMTNIHGKIASDYAYQLSEGTQRNRMAGGGNMERVRGKPWRLLAYSSGNVSMYAQMAMVKGDTKAEMQRLLELRVDEMPLLDVDPLTSENLLKDVQTNYGHFGPEFVQYIIRNREALAANYARIKAKLDKAAGLDNKNRFWSGGCAVILTGALAAKECGIINYDLKRLYKWVVKTLQRVKAFVDDSSSSVQTLVTEFATEHWGSILKLKSTDDGRAEAALVIPENDPRGKFVARFETDTCLFFIKPRELKAWLGEQKIDYTSTVEGMMKEMGATRVKMRLSKGTTFDLPPTWTICVRLNGFGSTSETA